MDSQLQSISKIFIEKIYRIPDYQRGYAWTEKQLKDYWGDILQLEDGKNHYVGVLTLEKVSEEIYKFWDDDLWIIKSRSYNPYYIVDGQQRLTTTIILIQAILEVVGENSELNFTDTRDIKRKFIFESKPGHISRSYIFGYEKDNPSYEFLKTKIFNENSTSNLRQETIYTLNLENAKFFFLSRLQGLTHEEIGIIYKKVTQNLLFNQYTISEDIDVFIAFETMNNRGKALSNLELLKNRLIYLSTKFRDESHEKEQLRKRINDSWKSVYHSLGKNKDRPLNDDSFLMNHYIAYFGDEIAKLTEGDERSYRRELAWYKDRYMNDLLEERFTVKSIYEECRVTTLYGKRVSVGAITIDYINKYVENLQSAVEIWYDLYNPFESKYLTKEEQIWIDRINKLDFYTVAPLVLSVLSIKSRTDSTIKLLRSLERLLFLFTFMGIRVYDLYDFLGSIRSGIATNESNALRIAKQLDQMTQHWIEREDFVELTINRLKDGFYNWGGTKYFLFEYEQFLKRGTRQKRNKIDWEELSQNADDFVTIEHIFPQNFDKKDCWKKEFGKFTKTQRRSLCNSLGNLLPLSKPKNSSLQNDCFAHKVDSGVAQVGYRYGSLSENEVAKEQNWGPMQILSRGLKMLDFLEKRWEVDLGDENAKIKLLGLEFLKSHT